MIPYNYTCRDSKRPKISFKTLGGLSCEAELIYVMSSIILWLYIIMAAGASIVQWNRINGNILASAHDSDIRIWDLKVLGLN